MATSQKKLKNSPPQGGGGGQELNVNVKELTNLETPQVSTFELHVENITLLLLCEIQ